MRAGFAVATFPRLGKVLVRGQATDGIAHRPGEWRRRGACPSSRCRAQPSKRITVRAPCSRRRPHRSGETKSLCGHAPEPGADLPERALDRMACRRRSMAGRPTGRTDHVGSMRHGSAGRCPRASADPEPDRRRSRCDRSPNRDGWTVSPRGIRSIAQDGAVKHIREESRI